MTVAPPVAASEQRAKLLGAELRLAQDIPQCPAVQLPVHWNSHWRAARRIQAYVASTRARDSIARFAERENDLLSRADRAAALPGDLHPAELVLGRHDPTFLDAA